MQPVVALCGIHLCRFGEAAELADTNLVQPIPDVKNWKGQNIILARVMLQSAEELYGSP